MLGEITVGQSLTFAQRRALVEGRVLSAIGGGVITIDHNGRRVTIRPQNMISLPPPTVLGDIESKVDLIVEGMSRKSSDGGSAAVRAPAPARAATPTRPAIPAAPRAANPRGTAQRGTENKGQGEGPPAVTFTPSRTRSTPVQGSAPAISSAAYEVDPQGVLANRQARQQAAQGIATMVHGAIIASLDRQVARDFERAFAELIPRIEAWRRQGNWVRVTAVFTVPQQIDLLSGVFRGPGQYLTFYALQTERFPDPQIPPGVTFASEEELLEYKVRQISKLSRRQDYGRRPSRTGHPRPIGPGRRLATHRELLAIRGMEEDKPLPWGLFPPATMFSPQYELLKAQAKATLQEDVMRRGVLGRCTRDGDESGTWLNPLR